MEQGQSRLNYQPALDGLRAVAVLAVIAYHDGYSWARGGFLGVDAFFVLSGFLITTLLVLEYRRIESIELLAFWGRRLRRLLPALLLVLVAVAIYSAVVVSPFELAQIRGDSLSSLFYFTNWRFIAEDSSYFAFVASPSPVQHLWSLAIEEQFYLVWPLVVLVCLRVAHGRLRILVAVSAVGVVLSTIVMAALYDSTDPSRAYYGTDSRSHTILIGALLALWLVTRPPRAVASRRAVQAAGVVGALGMVWALHSMSDVSSGYYHGGSLVYATAVAALIAAVVQPVSSPLRWGLALAPVVWVGRISYGLYLWHWPVNVYLNETRVGLAGGQLNALRLVATFALATVSYHLLEMPIRRGALRARPLRWIAPAAIAFTGIALVAATAGAEPVPSYLAGGGNATSINVRTGPTTTTTTFAPSPEAAIDLDTAKTRSSLGPGARAHIGVSGCPPPRRDELAAARSAARGAGPAPAPVPGGPVRVLVIGDSLACSVNIGLEPAGEPAIRTHQIAMVGCGVVSDEVFDESEPYPMFTEECHRIVTGRELDALAEFRPSVVLWISTWERFNLVENDKVLMTGTAAWHEALQRRMDAQHDVFKLAGARIVIMTVPPPAPAAMIGGGRIVSPEFDWRFASMNQQIAAFAARHPDVSLVDMARKLCPLGPQCPAEVDGFEPRHDDGVHFPPEAAVWVSRLLMASILTPPTAPATPATTPAAP